MKKLLIDCYIELDRKKSIAELSPNFEINEFIRNLSPNNKIFFKDVIFVYVFLTDSEFVFLTLKYELIAYFSVLDDLYFISYPKFDNTIEIVKDLR